jgi:hypothetical protein
MFYCLLIKAQIFKPGLGDFHSIAVGHYQHVILGSKFHGTHNHTAAFTPIASQ